MSLPIAPLSLSCLQTESRNPHTDKIGTVSTLELCQIINSQDALVALAVNSCLHSIADAIDRISERVRKGGRMISFGAGTSGRLGVLDASELPPTFQASSSQFIALIAGGDGALRSSIEGAEDSPELGAQDLIRQSPTSNDVILAISSSGRTPYVLGALRHGRSVGCLTVGLACTSPSQMRTVQVDNQSSKLCDVLIECITGAEVVTGSTRLKAGTATKMILNMISTGVMIKLGKTYGNLMVDLKVANAKLQARARSIVLSICPEGIHTRSGTFVPSPSSRSTGDERVVWEAAVDDLVSASDGSVKLAILVGRLGCGLVESRKRLEDAGGVLDIALKTAEETESGKLAQEIYEDEQYAFRKIDRAKLVLCIDGGGTKTAAVIAEQGGGFLARGEAGTSNFTVVGLKATLRAIHAATAAALAALPLSHLPASLHTLPSPTGTPIFTKVWAGIAGVDRTADFLTVLPALAALFSLSHTDGSVRLTNDGFLLASPIQRNPETQEGVVVIAGTGSIAISFRAAEHGLDATVGAKRSGELNQIRRSGGWGYLLGDEGSAYMTGRSAIRATLVAIEENATLLPWQKDILAHFGAVSKHQLISCVSAMASEENDPHGTENARKIRIATSAMLVFRAAFEGDMAALRIVKGTAKEVVELMKPLIKSVSYPEGITPAKSTLSLGGALMRQKEFQGLLVAEMKAMESWEWNKVEVVGDAAMAGALLLAEEQ